MHSTLRLLFVASTLLALSACTDTTDNRDTDVTDNAVDQRISIPVVDKDKKAILFFGDSLTEGYGLDEDEAFPARIQDILDSLDYDNYEVINAGLSGETSAGGKARVGWAIEQGVDIFVLELGANDGMRGIEPKATYDNLAAIIDSVRTTQPDAKILLAGMLALPNMGHRFEQQFNEVFPRLAKAKDVEAYLPFLLEGVAAEPDLNLEDGIHPNEEGQRIVARNVWKVLEPMLNPEG